VGRVGVGCVGLFCAPPNGLSSYQNSKFGINFLNFEF
jgi:hypothetical protein